MHRAPTIHQALRARLGREPTHRELVAEVRRILNEALIERAERGQLAHQR